MAIHFRSFPLYMGRDDLSTSLRLNVRSLICYIFLVCILVIEVIKIKIEPGAEAVISLKGGVFAVALLDKRQTEHGNDPQLVPRVQMS